MCEAISKAALRKTVGDVAREGARNKSEQDRRGRDWVRLQLGFPIVLVA